MFQCYVPRTCTHTHTHMHTHMNAHMHMHTRMHAHTHECTHAHAHTCTHTHSSELLILHRLLYDQLSVVPSLPSCTQLDEFFTILEKTFPSLSLYSSFTSLTRQEHLRVRHRSSLQGFKHTLHRLCSYGYTSCWADTTSSRAYVSHSVLFHG